MYYILDPTMSGGFIPVPLDPPVHPETQALLSLTPRQERRLFTFLDDRLTSLERDARKLSLGSLPDLLPRLQNLLELILQIPPVEPWGPTRVSYLLTLTGPLVAYLVSVPLSAPPSIPATPARSEISEISDVSDALASNASGPSWAEQPAGVLSVLTFLRLVERGWLAVLAGDAWVPPGMPVKVPFGASVGQTERIRLRSIALASRERLAAWARQWGDLGGAGLPGVAVVDRVVATGWESEVVTMWSALLEVLAEG
ncbi:hypothetical protein Q5752_005610 [Cryptotrichosporon argae]